MPERAASFARVADAYERARPGYPADAVLWLAGETPCDVVDLGAGTGKLTRSLAALGHHVVAVEPLAEMLDRLRAAVPGATAVVGSAESMPLPDASVDVVACAQAFHWFDPGPALAEMARVLRPGGRIALVWNVRDERVPWVDEMSDAMVGRTGVDRALRGRSSRAASTERSSARGSSTRRTSTARRCASSCSHGATARSCPRRSALRSSAVSTRSSTRTRATGC